MTRAYAQDTFSRFDTIPDCDRQTDRRTDILLRQHIMRQQKCVLVTLFKSTALGSKYRPVVFVVVVVVVVVVIVIILLFSLIFTLLLLLLFY